MDDISIGFIGFGLIGGSIAKAIKMAHSNCHMIAYNYHTTKNESLELALRDKVIDEVVTDLSSSFGNLDYIFLCAPVLKNIEYLAKLQGMIKSDCIITDVGSVKGDIHQAAVKLQLDKNFIGGHPMAGSEKTGYEHASAHILENAFYILTPEPAVSCEAYTKFETLVKEMKAIPIRLDSKTHDEATAAISHVPHLLAASLIQMVKKHDSKEKIMNMIAAGGFKDMTRIASSSPTMWENICLSNKDSILKFIGYFEESLHDVKSLIEDGDPKKLYSLFESGKEYRDSLSSQDSGVIHKAYEVYVDIIDETGAIATIATILACNGVSIKNIGIIHNREFSEGVLRIEFYEEDAAIKTVELLEQYHYTIYKR